MQWGLGACTCVGSGFYTITRGTVRGPAPLQAPCVTNERHSVGSLKLHTYYPNSKPSTHWKGVGGPARATPTAMRQEEVRSLHKRQFTMLTSARKLLGSLD